MAESGAHLVGAYGLFWDRGEVQWQPGSGRSWQLLGRRKNNRGTLQVCDFRIARGFYLLLNDYGVTYVGIARGAQGLGGRLRTHTQPSSKQPNEMRHAPKDWNRFCWFSFDDVATPRSESARKQPWRELQLNNQARAINVEVSAREFEALIIKVLGIKAQNQMNFLRGQPWEQTTVTDCLPGGALTKVDPTKITDSWYREVLAERNQ
ncbi:hypothetical protein EUA06_15145 [Nocardioides glacieisoli]|uniref:Uncharacterized protein n=1 Tax=Nocardioides glacieisoli TaxID=1168730 RepID=A0A4Q2RN83_9ACTN|nr:hypothetical protein [Nocardioides glacieisoli]RYB89324.1 hypothetical protein EUA06_15145 [Nocardioides glacieisoli]